MHARSILGSLWILSAIFLNSSCSKNEASDRPLTILIDQAPATLNPRSASDATGQRLGMLFFRALTRLDADLQPRPDLAAGWEVKGNEWRFRVPPGERDHAGQEIDAVAVGKCLENYRVGKPIWRAKASFPHWIGTKVEGEWVVLSLSQPDPYLPRNVSSLRYFRSPSGPCLEPVPGEEIVGSGEYRPALGFRELSPETELLALPIAKDRPPLRFVFVLDDSAKALRVLRGEVDVAPNAISPGKARWLQRSSPDALDIVEREGVSVSYLAFNMTDPTLSKREVRRAIAHAIDRERIVAHKFFGMGTLAGSFLSPLLPESVQTPFKPDLQEAERLLDRAGYPRGPDGVRLRLRYKCTPARDGQELALMLQDMLRKVGIELTLETVEFAVFMKSIRQGGFQLYSLRWVGVADASILHRTLHSQAKDNRVKYRDPEMDRILERLIVETDDAKRTALAGEAQRKMAEDLPYFPLWYWNNAVLIRKGLTGISPRDLSLSGSLMPLTALRIRADY